MAARVYAFHHDGDPLGFKVGHLHEDVLLDAVRNARADLHHQDLALPSFQRTCRRTDGQDAGPLHLREVNVVAARDLTWVVYLNLSLERFLVRLNAQVNDLGVDGILDVV